MCYILRMKLRCLSGAAIGLLILLCAGCSSALSSAASAAASAVSSAVNALVSYPEKITVGDKSYVRTFYNSDLFFNLYIRNPSESDKVQVDDKKTYYKVPHDSLELMTFVISGKGKDQPLYCLESQKAQAQQYYEDVSHWKYWCAVGKDVAEREKNEKLVNPADGKKFNELIDFCESTDYNPFNSTKNDTISKNTEDITSSAGESEIVFFKKSSDGLLTSQRGYVLRISGRTHLYHIYREGEEITGSSLPDELNAYFLPVAKKFGAK